jgi:molecular chaperone GrpE
VTHDRDTTQAAAEQAAAQPVAPETATDGVGPTQAPEGGEPGEPQEAAADEAAATEPAAPEPETETEPEPPAKPEPDYKDKWLRAEAELENVRKRTARHAATAEARGIARFARELLPALDNFERALAAAESQPENRDHHLTDGIRLVQAELLGALARVGIEPDSPKGERFDPHRHEAIAQQPVEGVEAGTIVEVYSAGYRKGDDVLRAAKVVVAA